MLTGELVTFGILVIFVVVIALVGRRLQTVHPAPGAAASGGTQDRRSERQNAGASHHSETTDAREGSSTRVRRRMNSNGDDGVVARR